MSKDAKKRETKEELRGTLVHGCTGFGKGERTMIRSVSVDEICDAFVRQVEPIPSVAAVFLKYIDQNRVVSLSTMTDTLTYDESYAIGVAEASIRSQYGADVMTFHILGVDDREPEGSRTLYERPGRSTHRSG